MKRFQTLKFLPLVAVAFAAACTDSTTAPVTPARALLVPNGPLFAAGEAPPPPVDAAVVVCAGGACAVFSATYNASKGSAPVAAAAIAGATIFTAAAEEDDPDDPGEGTGVCFWTKKASLKFDKQKKPKHHGDGDVQTTGKARIVCKNLVASGRGTLEFDSPSGRVVVMLKEVIDFDNRRPCSGSCADFSANATVGDQTEVAMGQVFERSYFDATCQIVPAGEGGSRLSCDD